MNQVILIHGMPDKEEYFSDVKPSSSNKHWFPWMQKKLAMKEILSQALEMPHPYNPIYEDHCEVFEQMKISSETILVGHSCGAGFLLRYFSEHPELKPKKIILVAPWIDPEPRELDTGFFDFTIDTTLTDRTNLIVFYSTDDDKVCVRSAEIIKDALPNATYYKFDNKGHFTKGDLGTEEFPELLEEILK
ncbi:MAG TPA: alpha/beta hydrolase [Candidatus Paceibacterota bacterium]|nr:alpha/beta hydrolase [Candidatus Paceibacterota bacterium]